MALGRHLSASNVISVTALVVALSGSAYAGVVLRNGSVTTSKLAPAAVTSSKLANHAVSASKLAKGAVTASSLASNAVGTANIAAGAVTANSVAPGTIPATALAAGVLGGVSSAKISIVPGAAVTVASNSVSTATASCPAGQRAIAGGFDVGAAFIDASGPTPDGLGWQIRADTTAYGPGGPSATVTATVVCAAP